MSLGSLQELVMLAVARLGPEAYGARIRDELQEVAGRRVSVPTVYVTLIRLEERGFATSDSVDLDAGKGGRARRVFRLTREGWGALEEARRSASRMWEGVVRR